MTNASFVESLECCGQFAYPDVTISQLKGTDQDVASTRYFGHFMMNQDNTDGLNHNVIELPAACFPRAKDSPDVTGRHCYRIRMTCDFDPNLDDANQLSNVSVACYAPQDPHKRSIVLAELKPVLQQLVREIVRSHHHRESTKPARRKKHRSVKDSVLNQKSLRMGDVVDQRLCPGHVKSDRIPPGLVVNTPQFAVSYELEFISTPEIEFSTCEAKVTVAKGCKIGELVASKTLVCAPLYTTGIPRSDKRESQASPDFSHYSSQSFDEKQTHAVPLQQLSDTSSPVHDLLQYVKENQTPHLPGVQTSHRTTMFPVRSLSVSSEPTQTMALKLFNKTLSFHDSRTDTPRGHAAARLRASQQLNWTEIANRCGTPRTYKARSGQVMTPVGTSTMVQTPLGSLELRSQAHSFTRARANLRCPRDHVHTSPKPDSTCNWTKSICLTKHTISLTLRNRQDSGKGWELVSIDPDQKQIILVRSPIDFTSCTSDSSPIVDTNTNASHACGISHDACCSKCPSLASRAPNESWWRCLSQRKAACHCGTVPLRRTRSQQQSTELVIRVSGRRKRKRPARCQCCRVGPRAHRPAHKVGPPSNSQVCLELGPGQYALYRCTCPPKEPAEVSTASEERTMTREIKTVNNSSVHYLQLSPTPYQPSCRDECTCTYYQAVDRCHHSQEDFEIVGEPLTVLEFDGVTLEFRNNISYHVQQGRKGRIRKQRPRRRNRPVSLSTRRHQAIPLTTLKKLPFERTAENVNETCAQLKTLRKRRSRSTFKPLHSLPMIIGQQDHCSNCPIGKLIRSNNVFEQCSLHLEGSLSPCNLKTNDSSIHPSFISTLHQASLRHCASFETKGCCYESVMEHPNACGGRRTTVVTQHASSRFRPLYTIDSIGTSTSVQLKLKGHWSATIQTHRVTMYLCGNTMVSTPRQPMESCNERSIVFSGVTCNRDHATNSPRVEYRNGRADGSPLFDTLYVDRPISQTDILPTTKSPNTAMPRISMVPGRSEASSVIWRNQIKQILVQTREDRDILVPFQMGSMQAKCNVLINSADVIRFEAGANETAGAFINSQHGKYEICNVEPVAWRLFDQTSEFTELAIRVGQEISTQNIESDSLRASSCTRLGDNVWEISNELGSITSKNDESLPSNSVTETLKSFDSGAEFHSVLGDVGNQKEEFMGISFQCQSKRSLSSYIQQRQASAFTDVDGKIKSLLDLSNQTVEALLQQPRNLEQDLDQLNARRKQRHSAGDPLATKYHQFMNSGLSRTDKRVKFLQHNTPSSSPCYLGSNNSNSVFLENVNWTTQQGTIRIPRADTDLDMQTFTSTTVEPTHTFLMSISESDWIYADKPTNAIPSNPVSGDSEPLMDEPSCSIGFTDSRSASQTSLYLSIPSENMQIRSAPGDLYCWARDWLDSDQPGLNYVKQNEAGDVEHTAAGSINEYLSIASSRYPMVVHVALTAPAAQVEIPHVGFLEIENTILPSMCAYITCLSQNNSPCTDLNLSFQCHIPPSILMVTNDSVFCRLTDRKRPPTNFAVHCEIIDDSERHDQKSEHSLIYIPPLCPIKSTIFIACRPINYLPQRFHVTRQIESAEPLGDLPEETSVTSGLCCDEISLYWSRFCPHPRLRRGILLEHETPRRTFKRYIFSASAPQRSRFRRSHVHSIVTYRSSQVSLDPLPTGCKQRNVSAVMNAYHTTGRARSLGRIRPGKSIASDTPLFQLRTLLTEMKKRRTRFEQRCRTLTSPKRLKRIGESVKHPRSVLRRRSLSWRRSSVREKSLCESSGRNFRTWPQLPKEKPLVHEKVYQTRKQLFTSLNQPDRIRQSSAPRRL